MMYLVVLCFVMVGRTSTAADVSLRKTLEPIFRRNEQSGEVDLQYDLEETPNSRRNMRPLEKSRRYDFMFDPNSVSEIIGVPSQPSHLPEAEAILPGHTLIKPAFGMLKSSIKFPHRELENGAGVNGNWDNLGLKWGGRNERVKYSSFRRSNTPEADSLPNGRRTLSDYIMVVPRKNKSKPSFTLSNVVLDIENHSQAEKEMTARLKQIGRPLKKNVRLLMFVIDPSLSPRYISDLLTAEDSVDSFDEQSELEHQTYYMKSLENVHMDEVMDTRREDFVEVSGSDGSDEDDYDNLLSQEHFDDNTTKNLTKQEKFYASKNLFNTVKFDQDALEFDELIPAPKDHNSNHEKGRQWWFYNQVDFAPLKHDD